VSQPRAAAWNRLKRNRLAGSENGAALRWYVAGAIAPIRLLATEHYSKPEPLALNSHSSTAKTLDHALVHFSRYAHIVQIVFANVRELAGLIQIEDLAAFHF
jgi:hypothetical protein